MAARKENLNGASPTGIYAHIVGWGMSVPDNIMTNNDLAAIVETDDEWIRSRTGISERRIATDNESTATLGYKAAQQALDVANILPTQLDLIVVATSTPEHVFPSTASLIQDWLGASNAGAFDLSAACSGFVYALNMASDSIKAGSIQTALVIGAETMSRVLDWQDRSTCILFGDGAGAVVIQADEQLGGILSSVLRSDGAGADLLAIPTHNNRELNGHKVQKMHMAGREVFKFATRVVSESIREVVGLAGLEMSDIDLIVPHQANQRILQSAAKKLGLDIEMFVSNLDRYGNTSAASIPIALCEAVEKGRIHDEDNLVFVGFGGGLTWASMVLQWGHPEREQAKRLNRQRRQLAYTAARWRKKFRGWQRSVSQTIERTRPDKGRLHRLQHKYDQEDEHEE
jgi:3-oxoacyl-[acyl-carrier-protein] synthase III